MKYHSIPYASRYNRYRMVNSDYLVCPFCGKEFLGHKGRRFRKGYISRGVTAIHKLRQHLKNYIHSSYYSRI